ncbi:MAG: hypothetical protein Q6363_000910 [Candidatus Njordarchaeota archaeon]
MKLKLDKNSWNKLRRLGIQGLSIIIFDDAIGPIPKYVYSKHAKLIRRILQDRVFSSKVSILAKYACEAKLNDELYMIIECFDSVGERIKTNYIVAQIGEDADPIKVRTLLKSLKRKLNGLSNINREIIENYLKELL